MLDNSVIPYDIESKNILIQLLNKETDRKIQRKIMSVFNEYFIYIKGINTISNDKIKVSNSIKKYLLLLLRDSFIKRLNSLKNIPELILHYSENVIITLYKIKIREIKNV
jgi:hypothetical protein